MISLIKSTRSKENAIIFGVCGGLGEAFNISPNILRGLFVILAFSSSGFFSLVYLVLALMMPTDGQKSMLKRYQQRTVNRRVDLPEAEKVEEEF